MKLELLPGPKLMLIVLDGLGDRKIKDLGWKTPLEAAFKPNMDIMAKEGMLGAHYPLAPGIPVGSGIAHLLLFNYGLDEYPERGVLEALGIGAKLEEGDLAFRINFATFAEDGKIVLDRRAGRADFGLEELAKILSDELSRNPFGAEIEVLKGDVYRGALIVKNWGKDFKVHDTDPQMENLPVILPEGNREIDKLVRWIHEKAFEILKDHEINKQRVEMGLKPANGILLRGAGIFRKVEPFEERNGVKAAGIATQAIYLGAARYVGMEKVIRVDEDSEKIPQALKMFKKYEFVFVHFKETDNAGHDGDPFRKKEVIERIDSYLWILHDISDITVAITGDHATPCELRTHSGDLVPILVWGARVHADNVETFGESTAPFGGLGIIRARDLVPILSNLAGRMKEIGK